MGAFWNAFRLAYALSVGLGRAVGAVARSLAGLLGRRDADLGPVISKRYSDTAELQADARILHGKGYKIVSIAGLAGSRDLARAAIDGTLRDIAVAAIGIRTADKIVVVYEKGYL